MVGRSHSSAAGARRILFVVGDAELPWDKAFVAGVVVLGGDLRRKDIGEVDIVGE